MVMIFSLMIILAACSKPETGTENAEIPRQVEEGQKAPEPEKPGGEEKTGKAPYSFPTAGIRPYAVMIDNEGVKSLPQGGLDKAQIIYEIIVEGGETRLMPVFWGPGPDMVGPVRSSRHYFLDYAMEHDAIYVHFGWSPMAMQDISKFKINNINGVANGGEIFYDLTKDKNNWQDSYTSMEKIRDYVNKVKYRTTTDQKNVFEYNASDVELQSQQKAEKISLAFSSTYSCGFEYDLSLKEYKRIRKGSPHIERTTGSQFTAKNILIQLVENGTIKGDDAGRQWVSDVGTGSGWFVTCGKAVKLKWAKASRTAQTVYTDEKGEAIKLNPGQTWIEIVPVNGKVAMQ